MHSVSRRNMIKSLLIAPVTGYSPFFNSIQIPDKEENNHDFEPGYLKTISRTAREGSGSDLQSRNTATCSRPAAPQGLNFRRDSLSVWIIFLAQNQCDNESPTGGGAVNGRHVPGVA